jgi:ParB/RepB/Spo0J family partition protein
MMTQEAIKADAASGVPLVEVGLIYSDSEFNCRGTFTATDIIELAKDIAARGLVEPVILRPLWVASEKAIIDRGFKYSLVAGFRRYASYKVNKAEKIPAIIREVQSDFEARDINAVENLQRLDLTFYQEAKSIRHYWVANWNRKDIAARINKSEGWVQMRILLLEMEPEIQNAANQGYILPSDMHELNKYKGAERLQIAGRLRDARKSGEGKGVMHKLKQKDRANTKKRRQASDIQALSDHIREWGKKVDRDQMVMISEIVSPQGNTISNRIMAWACGEITTFDVHVDIRMFFKRLGVAYQMPEFAE